MTPLDVEGLLAEGTRLRALARDLAGGAAAADDLVQETWLRALQRPPRSGFSWRAWIGGLVRNVEREQRRAETRRASHEAAMPAAMPRPAAEDPLEAAARFELLRRVLAHVDELGEPQRTTLIRRYVDGLEPIEIARRDGVPDATIRSRIKRGLDEVRARLDADHGDERGPWLAVLAPWTGVAPPPAASATALPGGLVLKASASIGAALVMILTVIVTVQLVQRSTTPAEAAGRAAPSVVSQGRTPQSDWPPAVVAATPTRAEDPRTDPAAGSGPGAATTADAAGSEWRVEGILRGLVESVPWTGSIRLETLTGDIGPSVLGPSAPAPSSTQPDAEGRFAIALHRDSPEEKKCRGLRVTAIDPAYLDVASVVETLDEHGSPRAAPFTFHVELKTRPSARLHGRIVDEDGHPVEGAHLHWDEEFRHEGAEEWEDMLKGTGHDGRYAYESGALDHTVLVVHPPGRLGGGSWLPPPTNERGLMQTAVEIAVEPGSDRLVPDVVLKRGVTIRGTVIDDEGRGVGGTRVAAIPLVDSSTLPPGSAESIEWSHAGEADASADRDGEFVIVGLRPGPWGVAVCGRGELLAHPTVSNSFRDKLIRVVAPADSVEVLDWLARVELQLHLNGVPFRKRAVSVEGTMKNGDTSVMGVTTDRDGRVAFLAVRGLKYRVLPDGPDVEHSTPPFVLAEDESERVVTLELEPRRPRASLALTLHDPAGATVTRAWILIAAGGSPATSGREYIVDSADGGFLVEDLDLGPAVVRVRPGGFHFGAGGFYQEERFELDLVAPRRFERSLEVRATGRLSVHAVDREGASVPADCSLTTQDGAPVSAGFVRTGADIFIFSPTGTLEAPAFVTPPPPPGRYRLEFKAKGFAPQTVDTEVVVGRTTEVVVTLERS